jgi:hypothetical protein
MRMKATAYLVRHAAFNDYPLFNGPFSNMFYEDGGKTRQMFDMNRSA